VCCSVLQWSMSHGVTTVVRADLSVCVLQCVLQCAAIWCSVLQHVAVIYESWGDSSWSELICVCVFIACVAAWCSMLQCVAVCCGDLRVIAWQWVVQWQLWSKYICVCACAAACCSVLQRVAARCSVLQRVAACCNDLWVIVWQLWLYPIGICVCCSVCLLQRVAACCSMLQCVAMIYESWFDSYGQICFFVCVCACAYVCRCVCVCACVYMVSYVKMSQVANVNEL